MGYRRHHNEQICQGRGPTSKTLFSTKGIFKAIKYFSPNFLFYMFKSKIPCKTYETLYTLCPVYILCFILVTKNYPTVLFK